jgi:hypothetical protein
MFDTLHVYREEDYMLAQPRFERRMLKYFTERTSCKLDPRLPNDDNDRVPQRSPGPDSPPVEPERSGIKEPRKEPPPLIVR